MAPELVSDPERVCEKADVWSLGVVMWEMLTRRTPFQVCSYWSTAQGGMEQLAVLM
jgi:serine/threonine protein kinase